MADQFDVVVIGSGPGGYVCAIKAAQLGMNVAIVEKSPTLGGTCLNVGCIPSKALLHASEMFHEAEHGFEKLGIKTSKPKLDLPKMMEHKDATVKANVDGVAFLMKKNKVTVFHGTGAIASANSVTVTDEAGKAETLSTKNIVIATGSVVAGIPGVDVEFDGETIVSSDHAIALPKVPKDMVVVGGGVIGLELGSVWSRLGAKVTVVEYLGAILGGILPDAFGSLGEIYARSVYDVSYAASFAVMGGVGVFTLFAIAEQPRPLNPAALRQGFADVPTVIAEAGRLAVNHPSLSLLLAALAVVLFATNPVEVFWPTYAKPMLNPDYANAAIGTLTAGYFFSIALGASLSSGISRIFKRRHAVTLAAIFSCLAAVQFALTVQSEISGFIIVFVVFSIFDGNVLLTNSVFFRFYVIFLNFGVDGCEVCV